MKVGIIGVGMVGDAINRGLNMKGFETKLYDIKFPETSINDVLDTNITFVSVPTKPDEHNRCDTSILEKTVKDLKDLQYKGVIVVKSTVSPGTTDKLIDMYPNLKICFCPEFLRERCALEDYIHNNYICIVGTNDPFCFDIVSNVHKDICKQFKMVPPIEAELTKYFQNVYNTCRVIFANGFYEICKINDVHYNSIISSLVSRREMDDRYLRCNDKLRGPSGPCLMKDTLAFNEYIKTLELENTPMIFETLIQDAKKYPKTVIKGTREEKEYFGRNL